MESIGEHGLIARIRTRADLSARPCPWVTLGIGDDAAVLAGERGAVQVVTTDSLIESVHFRRDWTPAAAIGHRALAVNLSDLAAMGATPRAALLSLALPPSLPLEEFDALIDGVVTLGERYDAPLVGGNLARSPGPLVINMTAIGSAHPRRVIRRDTARAGHELYVTGSIGAAATGRALLDAGRIRASVGNAAAACIERYERPEPRLMCGVQVARNRAASAGIDLSDGLGDAARQLAAASRTGVVIEAGRLPIHPGAVAWAATAGLDAAAFAVNGGDDYELLFAVAPRQRRAFLHATSRCHGLPVTRIGYLTTDDGAWLERDGAREPLARGFAHF